MKILLKRSLSVLLAAVMVFGAAASIGGFDFGDIGIKAEAATSGYYTYTVDENGNAAITGVNSSISGDIVIPSTLDGYPVTSIGVWAFYYCTSITSVEIPDSVTSIKMPAFNLCYKLTSITVDPANTEYSNDEFGVLFNKDKTELIYYPEGNARTSYEIPDSVTSIGRYAFEDCESITSIEIPDSVTSIGDSAFYSCDSLASIEIGNGVTSIGKDAFHYCDSLTSIEIPRSVTSIGVGAFSECDSLTSITVDPANTAYSSDESGVLFNKDKTALIQYLTANARTSYEIPDSVTSIGDGAFYGCKSLTSVTIPDSVTSIGEDAFYDCYGLTSISIPDSVTSIGEDAFYDCYKLTSIEIGNGVTSIGYGAFNETGYYKDSSNWENDVLYIDNYLIKADYGITGSCEIKEGTVLVSDYAFAWKDSLTSVTIPDSVTSIGDGAFQGCKSLTSIEVPDSVTSIGAYAFYNTGYYNDSSNWENDVLYIDNCLIEAKDTITGSYEIKEGTIKISKEAFWSCGSLTSVIIPDSVTSIGEAAFEWCTGLTSIEIGNGVTSIGVAAFQGCESLTSIEIPNSVTSIGYGAFAECHSLTSVEIPDSVTSTGDYAFYNCYSLTSVKILDSVTSIGEGAFASCAGLTSIEIPDSVTSIGVWAFVGCTGLTSVEIPDSVTSIGDEAFCECLGLEYIHIPSSVTSLGKSIVSSDAQKAEQVESIKTEFENAAEEELAYYAEMGITKEKLESWKPTTIICSDTADCAAKAYAETNGNKFVVCDGVRHGTTNPEEPTTQPEEPTTRPEEPTTQPEEPTTKPTEPSTTKPAVEEEIIKKPSTTEVKYGETLILHADFTNIPADAKIEWSVEGEGVTIKPSADGKTCAVTSTATGDATITAKYVDANGVEHISEQEIESNASIWQRIVSFFKNLFGISRIIEQAIKF